MKQYNKFIFIKKNNIWIIYNLPDISKWNMSNVENINGLFYGCSSLKSLPDISHWNTNNIENMEGLFYECINLIQIPDISNWNISNVKNISYLFYGCSSLKSLPDISNWNLINVTNLNCLFYQCSSLLSLPDISKWIIPNLTEMIGTFYECSSLNSFPNISNLSINNIEDISYIFYHCSSLDLLPDISKWIIKFKSNSLKFNAYFYSYINIISFSIQNHPFLFLHLINNLEDLSEKILDKLFTYLLFSDLDFVNDNQINFEIFFNYLLYLPDTSKWTYKTIEDIDYKLQTPSYISKPYNELFENFSNMTSNQKHTLSSIDNSISLSNNSNNNQENISQYFSNKNLIDPKDNYNSLNNDTFYNNNSSINEYYEHFYDSSY